jgi:hypothetical protein
MRTGPHRWLSGMIAIVIGIAAAGLTAAPALATGHHSATHRHRKHADKHHQRRTPSRGGSTATVAQESATGNLTAAVFSVQFSASRAQNSAATSAIGQFTARTMVGSATLMTVSGPVTCLDIVGNRLGLFYPVTSSTPSVLADLHVGVYFYAELGANVKPEAVNFVPVPTAHASSCAPLPDLIPVSSGTLTLTP